MKVLICNQHLGTIDKNGWRPLIFIFYGPPTLLADSLFAMWGVGLCLAVPLRETVVLGWESDSIRSSLCVASKGQPLMGQ